MHMLIFQGSMAYTLYHTPNPTFQDAPLNEEMDLLKVDQKTLKWQCRSPQIPYSTLLLRTTTENHTVEIASIIPKKCLPVHVSFRGGFYLKGVKDKRRSLHLVLNCLAVASLRNL